MPITAAALRELHRIHRQLTDLRSRLDRGPKQIAAVEANLARLEQSYESTKQSLTQCRMASDEKQLQLKQREDRIKDLQNKLNTCASNREYQALKEQIAADEQANSVLSDEILELLEKLDVLQANVSEAKTTKERTASEFETLKNRVANEGQTLESELGRVSADLSRAESELQGDFKTVYQRISKVRGEEALAQVDGESCGSCFQMLSPQTMNELYLEKPVFCSSCGALMYLPEGRTPRSTQRDA